MSLKKAKSEILEKVHQIQKIHPGGEAFFDALDKEIIETASDEMMLALFSLVPKNHFLVLSGGFGRTLAEKIDNGTLPRLPYHLYNGGIRSGKKPEIIRKSESGKLLTDAIFLDDSIYGGATYYALKEVYSHSTQRLKSCAVIYDGCPVVKSDIKSVFRYYDHFSATPNYKF